ncbi:pyridoxamine 5'-phosphate oxidase family protein [Methanobacterium sp.]|uniref:pyridoxamine 5'-phosphate oxidase family protein n=1 Tax=Methanobacterium sp. TaxID=2164 RepID=UPI0031593E04
MNEEDKKALQLFSGKIGFEIEDISNFNLDEVLKYALELKLIKDDLIPNAPSPKVKKTIENFLTTHNTCTLSTSYKNRVRSTPIEYLYINGFMYFLSEGGEKFSNIPLNKNISVAVYDDYTSMNSLAGMQITGSAYIIPEDTDEYYDVIKMKGLNENFIKNLQFNMNIIKIEINKIEFLYSKFKEMDFEPKQIYFFPKHL